MKTANKSDISCLCKMVDHNAYRASVKKMATCTFTHNSLRKKTLTTLIKMHRKVLRSVNKAFLVHYELCKVRRVLW